MRSYSEALDRAACLRLWRLWERFYRRGASPDDVVAAIWTLLRGECGSAGQPTEEDPFATLLGFSARIRLLVEVQRTRSPLRAAWLRRCGLLLEDES